MSKLSVYWWSSPKQVKNLGDELTSIFLSRYFGVDHQIAPIGAAKLVSTGSILSMLPPKRKDHFGIVGSGLMHPVTSIEGLDRARVYSVRGYLTRQLLEHSLPSKPLLGDPGLLASKLTTLSPRHEYTYGLIPHHSRVTSNDFLSRFKMLESVKLIDFRTDDIDTTIEQMLSCKIILSQGLHGLIIADSLGLPNVWVNTDTLHKGGEFKFYDYFSTVRRPFDLGLFKQNSFDDLAIYKNLFEANRSWIYSRQQEISDAFCQFFEDFKVPYSLGNAKK